MSIGPSLIDIDLDAATPTKVTVDILKSQLDAIGLTCEEADPENLERYIEEVRAQYPDGRVQCFDIREEDGTPVPVKGSKDVTCGNWIAHEPWEHTEQLAYIQHPENFDWLVDNRPSFGGTKVSTPQYSGKAPTAEILKGLFVDVAHNISSSLLHGIDREAVEAAISTAITPMEDGEADDYDPGEDTRVILLVDGYDKGEKQAKAVGVLNVQWKLYIKNYKKKKAPQMLRKWTLDVTVRSVLYNVVDNLMADYKAVSSQMRAMVNPRVHRPFLSTTTVHPLTIDPIKVEIFSSLPDAGPHAYDRGVPLQGSQDYADVIVLYGARFENIGSVDNTKSTATSTWSRAVSKGFTFEAAQQISSTTSIEVSAIVATISQSITLAFSFTESWNTTTTETIEFSVPPGKLAFTYQGYTMARILRYTPKNDSFKYEQVGRVLSPSICTSEVPLEFK